MKRPECFDFAMDFVGEPEETQVRQYVEGLEARLAEREAQIKRWQDSSGCVGTFCKADIMLDRNRELQARLAEADARLHALLIGLEVPPSAWVVMKPEGFMALGAAIAAQAKRATVSAPAVPIIKADGMILENGIEIIGDVHWHADVKQWRCLANVGGSLCVIEVKVTPDSAPTCLFCADLGCPACKGA